MLKAVGRYFRALGYLVTGRVDAARRALSTSPYVVNATYDQIIVDKTRSVHQYKDAIARLIAQHESKIAKVRSESGEVNHLEQLKEGAAAKARTTINQLRSAGASMEDIKSNADYQKCLLAFNEFSAKIEEKNKRIAELEGELKEMDQSIQSHKIQLQQMLREVEKLREEQTVAVAEILTAKEEAQIGDMLANISQDRTSRELQEMRQLRAEMKAKARVSKELAGTDSKVQEAEFLAYARENVASDEFDRLIGLADAADRDPATGEAQRDTRLPE